MALGELIATGGHFAVDYAASLHDGAIQKRAPIAGLNAKLQDQIAEYEKEKELYAKVCWKKEELEARNIEPDAENSRLKHENEELRAETGRPKKELEQLKNIYSAQNVVDQKDIAGLEEISEHFKRKSALGDRRIQHLISRLAHHEDWNSPDLPADFYPTDLRRSVSPDPVDFDAYADGDCYSDHAGSLDESDADDYVDEDSEEEDEYGSEEKSAVQSDG